MTALTRAPAPLHRALFRPLRRDRVLIPVWVAVDTLMVLVHAGHPRGPVRHPGRTRRPAAAGWDQHLPAGPDGPVFGDSLGALTAWRVGVYAAVLAAVMSLLIVVRHTRDEEETGRQELIASGMVGRRASLTAALLAAGSPTPRWPCWSQRAWPAGERRRAAAFGLGLAGRRACCSPATAAIAAQLTESARLARA